jgi:hypothetical protein
MHFPVISLGYKLATCTVKFVICVSDLCTYEVKVGIDAPFLNPDTKKLDQNAASLYPDIAY